MLKGSHEKSNGSLTRIVTILLLRFLFYAFVAIGALVEQVFQCGAHRFSGASGEVGFLVCVQEPVTQAPPRAIAFTGPQCVGWGLDKQLAASQLYPVSSTFPF